MKRLSRAAAYLCGPDKWREYDPDLFQGLAAVLADGSRRVQLLLENVLLSGAEFCDEAVPAGGKPAERRAGRAAWFAQVQARIVSLR